MHADRDFDMGGELPANELALTQDLGLKTLFDAMADGDEFLFEVARRAVLSSLDDPAAIIYRQRILEDCLKQAATVRQIHDIAADAIQREKKIWRGWFGQYPDAILRRSVESLELFVGSLKRLRRIADDHAADFRSPGFTAFFQMVMSELDDDYFQTVEGHLRRLRFRHGVLVSAELGKGNRGTSYVLREPHRARQSWLDQIFRGRTANTLRISDRDESGAKALAELRGRGINLAANALAQSTDHILSFFTMLRCESGFYVGCLNARDRLVRKGEPLCLPTSSGSGRVALSCRGLYDVCLSLRTDAPVVGNDVDADDKSLIVITGANQGGKSTFLRSIGLAQLMMQCGMFAPAQFFAANLCQRLFTHFKREEDAAMNSGKLDEELSRMSEIADDVAPDCMVLFNESFAATNEREGSEIAQQIVRALLERGIKVFFVTHSFDLAHTWYQQGTDTSIFLRAERRPDGRRTFRLVVGEPLPTSYGQDLYERIFGAGPKAVAAAP